MKSPPYLEGFSIYGDKYSGRGTAYCFKGIKVRIFDTAANGQKGLACGWKNGGLLPSATKT